MSELDFVDIRGLDPSVEVFLPYATTENVSGRAVYPPTARALLRRPVAEALVAAHREVGRLGFRMKVLDAYRPFPIQEIFWREFPDERYVARPVRGADGRPREGSKHNRGTAVDLTMIDASGTEVEMPSGFDEFTERAHRNYAGASEQAIHHRGVLEAAMQRHGFIGFATEWWHFDFTRWKSFPLSEIAIEDVPLG